MSKLRTLIFDIETSPCIGWFWRPGNNQSINHSQITQDNKIICICYKWHGEDEVHSLQWDDNQCDKQLLIDFSTQLMLADSIIAHNGEAFDVKWVAKRIAYHGLPALGQLPTDDTMKQMKKHFNLNSNSLAYACKYFGLHLKTDPGGISTWMDIMFKKCPEAMKRMVEYCYSSDTEILTNNGFKLFTELTYKDEVANYYPDGRIAYHTPKDIIHLDYEGGMYHLTGRASDLLVSPNHRMVSLTSRGNLKVTLAKDFKTNMKSGHSLILAGEFRNDAVILSEKELATHKLNIVCHADGHFVRKVKEGNTVQFLLQKPRKINRLKELLELAEIDYTFSNNYPSCPGRCYFQFVAPFNKEVSESIFNLSLEDRLELIQEYGYWDGHIYRSKAKRALKNFRYSNTDLKECEKLLRLCITSGVSANIIPSKPNPLTKKQCYTVNVTGKKTACVKGSTYEKKPYAGTIHCVTVDSGMIVVRRNGKVAIGGNCENDVKVLDELYTKLLPYITPKQSTKITKHRDDEHACPVCGSENTVKWGFYRTSAGKYQKHRCSDCGHVSKSRFRS